MNYHRFFKEVSVLSSLFLLFSLSPMQVLAEADTDEVPVEEIIWPVYVENSGIGFLNEEEWIEEERTEEEQIEEERTEETQTREEEIKEKEIEEAQIENKKDTAKKQSSSKKQGMQVEQIIKEMSLEEKAAQLFIVLPEAITQVDCVTVAAEMTEEALAQYPVGGFIYMEMNLETEEQVKEMLFNVQDINMRLHGLPLFTCVDEEGGTVTRISGRGFDVPYIGDMCNIGLTEDAKQARLVGDQMGEYLKEYGFNVDFAPVADVLSNEENYVVRYRSFGADPDLTAQMSMEVVKGLQEHGVCATMKHFPGHGATVGDTHAGFAYTDKSYEEMKECELVPFVKGIEEGVDFIMVGHISLPNITEDNEPASLSHRITTEILREDLGYDGIIVTDALNMGAISQIYSSAEAAIKTIEAGADMILMPGDFFSAYYGVLDAVQSGRISEARIDQSLERILNKKMLLY